MDTTSTTRPSGARRHTQKKDAHLGRTIAGRRHARKPTPLPLALPTTRDDSQLHRSNNQSACTHARARGRPRPRSARASPGDQPQGGPPCDSPHHFFKSGNEFTLHTPNNRKGSSQKPKEAPPKKSAGGCEFRRFGRWSLPSKRLRARPRASLRREKALPAGARPRPGCVGGATPRVRARAGAAAPPVRRAPPPLAPISSPPTPPRGARCWTRSEGRRSDSGLSAAGIASTSIAS